MKSAELYLDIINLEEKKPENKPVTPFIQSTPRTNAKNSLNFKRATNRRGMPVGGSLRKTRKTKKRYNL